MSDPAVAVQRQQVRQQGLIAGLVTLPFRLFGVLIGSLVLCIVIECIGMHFLWPEQGWRHAQGMLNYELSQVSEHFTQSVLVQEPGRSARQLVEWAYQGLFVKTGCWTGYATPRRNHAPARTARCRTSATTSRSSTCTSRAT
jgi:integrating conjugative element membrane protein (TIGR03747 family)